MRRYTVQAVVHGRMGSEQFRIATYLSQKNAQGNYTRLGFVPWFDQGWHYTWGYDFGGNFFDAAACQVTPDDPAIVEAFAFIQDWAKAFGSEKIQTFISSYNRPEAPRSNTLSSPAAFP